MSGSCPTPQQAATRKFPITFLCDYAQSVRDAKTEKLLEYRQLIKHPKLKHEWKFSFGNEIGRLAQGMPGRNNRTDTLFFILKSQIPDDK